MLIWLIFWFLFVFRLRLKGRFKFYILSLSFFLSLSCISPCKNVCPPPCSAQWWVITFFQVAGCHILKQVSGWENTVAAHWCWHNDRDTWLFTWRSESHYHGHRREVTHTSMPFFYVWVLLCRPPCPLLFTAQYLVLSPGFPGPNCKAHLWLLLQHIPNFRLISFPTQRSPILCGAEPLNDFS